MAVKHERQNLKLASEGKKKIDGRSGACRCCADSRAGLGKRNAQGSYRGLPAR